MRAFGAIVASFVFAASSPAGAQDDGGAGIGISPVVIQFDDALRGGAVSATLTISNGTSDVDSRFEVTPTGDVAGWVELTRFDDGTDATRFVVPAGEVVQVVVQVRVPEDAANRTYEGAIQVLGTEIAEAGDGETGAGVQIGAEVALVVEVTGTEHREGTVSDFYVDNAEVGMLQGFNAAVDNLGNVQLLPRLDVTIKRDGEVAATISTEGQSFPVGPDLHGVVTAEWDTTEQLAGDYTAEMSVTDTAGAEPIVIGSRTVEFRLEPLGTFTRSGTLDELTVENTPELNGLAQVAAVFNNTGSIETTAVLVAEVYVDDELVEVVSSLERTAEAGSSVEIGLPLPVRAEGSYRLVGKVNFEGHETDQREVRFGVGVATGAGTTPLWPLIGGGAAVVGGAIVLGISRRGRRTRAAAARRRPKTGARTEHLPHSPSGALR